MGGVVFLGMPGTFSRVVLESLLASGVDVRALVVPGRLPRPLPPPRRLLHVSEPSATEVAWAGGLTVIEAPRPDGSEPPDLVRGLEPAALAVACFPWILPRPWLEMTDRRFNVHPSLLPAYRGPAPLFWQLRAGETRTGVTVHRLEEAVDAGAILAQAEMRFDDGLTRDVLDVRLAEVGARLLVEALRSPGPGRPRPQPTAGASRQGFPTQADLEVPTSWTARRAFNFIRGAAHWGPFTITGNDASMRVAQAVSFSSEGGEAGAVRDTDAGYEVGFSPGTVVVRP
jgi:methionyl-tRNA formyltransferase